MDTYAIVLYFDEVTSNKLNKVIQTVAELSGNHYMIDTKIPPHITIGSFLCAEPELLIKEVGNFAETIETFQVQFDDVRAFEPKVLFASPIKDEYLEKINIKINELLNDCFLPADNEYYTPEKWVPHCALAVRLDKEQFEKVKNIGNEINLPLFAEVQQIALAKCNPYEEKEVWDCLTKSEKY